MKAREVQTYLLLGVRTFQQFMRNVLAPLMVFMPAEINDQRGILLSAVAAGYFFTQVPGGAVADRIGPKFVVSVALAGSVAACFMIPVMYDMYGAMGMWWCLAFMGMITGPLFPATSVILSKWIPPAERSQASTMMDIGISIGALIAVPAGGFLGSQLGWAGAYTVVASCSLVFTLLWIFLSANEPASCSFISKQELEYLEDVVPAAKPEPSKTAAPKPSALGAFKYLLTAPVLSIFFSHMAFNYGAYFVTNFNPLYYKDVFSLTAATAGIHLTLPHFGNLVGKMLNNTVYGMLQRRGVSRLNNRKAFVLLSSLGSAGFMLPIMFVQDSPVWVTTVLVTTANFFFGFAPSGFKANYLDVTVAYTGIISGVGNTLGTVSSFVGPNVVALVLQHTGSWAYVFISIGFFNVVSSANFMLLASDVPVESRREKPH
ncbi:Sodium-dependent phosphate transport protein 1 [Diplonema papillatum]|nr:Sodium-dependent phosphate transport protein 1 [Diplonema papillatum]KAJ9451558.1 Sodium-dependent phosphate transport protein 1 [Diplonema papillatum]|eukprot:gene18681-28839_t